MSSPEKDNIEPVTRRRRVRKHRRAKANAETKKHFGFVPMGTNTARIRQQIANGDNGLWEGEYRE